MCVSTVFKAKTKEKYEEIFCFRFWFQTHKLAFWGSTNLKKKKNSVLALKSVDT